ncbi:MAG: tetratricopeptide repeat protein [Polyangiaceae bacterium]|nr:tetratricopeptide repeat protein [Polyangiaceae bacterium]
MVSTLAVPAACAHRRSLDHSNTAAAADRAYSHGRYAEAGALWLMAASAASRPRDAQEARYRAAKAFERAGQVGVAEALYDDLAADGASERAARAAFDRAELEAERGRTETGIGLRDQALRTYPDSGLAARALASQLAYYVTQGGPSAALAYLDQLASVVGKSELGEVIAYQRAEHLALAGDREAALASYLETAERFPYPYGAYWDDSLYHAAELAVALGRPREAVLHLERILGEREDRPLTGSLERPRFGAARFLLAQVRRDGLGDLAGARREFLRLVDEHPTSRLRDDALWEAAQLAIRLGDDANACQDAHRLAREFESSRYLGCLVRVCPSIDSHGNTPCPSYVAPLPSE